MNHPIIFPHRGVEVDPVVFERSLAYWKQLMRDGGWAYPGRSNSGSMTCAGIASVIIARGRLGSGSSQIKGDQIECCGGAGEEQVGLAEPDRLGHRRDRAAARQQQPPRVVADEEVRPERDHHGHQHQVADDRPAGRRVVRERVADEEADRGRDEREHARPDHGVADELLAEARRMADQLAAYAPFVPRTMKAMVNFGMEASLAGALMLEKYAQGALVQTEDKMEGISAFLEKRDPEFKGR